MGYYPSHCVRLSEKLQEKACPLLIQFQDENVARGFIRKKNITAANNLCKTTKIAEDITPLQRGVLDLQKGASRPAGRTDR